MGFISYTYNRRNKLKIHSKKPYKPFIYKGLRGFLMRFSVVFLLLYTRIQKPHEKVFQLSCQMLLTTHKEAGMMGLP